MTYTRAWSTSIPAGSRAANQIDSAIQEARLDIQERNNTIIGSGGNMSTDPVIDGSTVMSLTDLTTAVNTKTTLSGLTTGVLTKALSASSIGNSSITEAALTAALAALAALGGNSTHSNTSTTNVSKFTPTFGTGTWIVSFSCPGAGSDINYTEIKPVGATVTPTLIKQEYSSNISFFCMTALISVSVSGTIEFNCSPGSSGTYFLEYKKLSS
jgi:hypothetical protein